MGPKTLPTIWGTYMKLVAKYQISGINSATNNKVMAAACVFTFLTIFIVVLKELWFLIMYKLIFHQILSLNDQVLNDSRKSSNKHLSKLKGQSRDWQSRDWQY
jgi:hypothetical protein